MSFWQNLPSFLSPNILTTPWFSLHWYGLMYVIAYALIYVISLARLRKEDYHVTKKQLIDALTWSIVGLAIGARVFYVLIYEPAYYLAHPLEIILPVSNGVLTGFSGLSYHGGLIGIIIATLIYTKLEKIDVWQLVDLVIPVIPIGYAFGRLGNFINGELWGRVTSVPWGMYFPNDLTGALRHPSQLYEALFEGVILFIAMSLLRKRFKGPQILACYLIGYATARIVVEYFREPDPQIGLLFFSLTMGQILSFFMIFAGVVLMITQKYFGSPKKQRNG